VFLTSLGFFDRIAAFDRIIDHSIARSREYDPALSTVTPRNHLYIITLANRIPRSRISLTRLRDYVQSRSAADETKIRPVSIAPIVCIMIDIYINQATCRRASDNHWNRISSVASTWLLITLVITFAPV
jgi:hypothetical protein